MHDKTLNCIFFGTPDICLGVLDYLCKSTNINLSLIISMPDRPKGRGKQLISPEVAIFAKEHRVQLLQTKNVNKEEKFFDFVNENKIDFILVFAFSQFLSSKILSVAKLGAFNIHTSLLPLYRGAAPIQYALLNDDEITGVSIQKMVKKMDAGDIVKSLEYKIKKDENYQSLYIVMKKLSIQALDSFVEDMLNDNMQTKKQNENLVTFAPSINKQDGFIDFKNQTTKQIINKFKAFLPWPGIFFYLNSKRIAIKNITTNDLSHLSLKPGEVYCKYNNLIIGTLDSCVHLTRVQMDGKKECSDVDLLNGLKNKFDHFEARK